MSVGLLSSKIGIGDPLVSIDKVIETTADVEDVLVYDTRDDTDNGSWRFSTGGFTLGMPPRVMYIYSQGNLKDTVMVVDATDSATPLFKEWNVTNPSKLAALNGQIIISTTVGVVIIDMVADAVFLYDTTGLQLGNQTPGNFDMATVVWGTPTGDGIVNNTVNNVTILAKATAETNPARQNLPFATVAAVTDGGCSVNNPSGTAANLTTVNDSAVVLNLGSVAFDTSENLYFGRFGTSGFWRTTDYSTNAFASTQFGTASIPPVPVDGGNIAADSEVYIGGSFNNPLILGFCVFHDGLVSKTENTYCTGFMEGDIEVSLTDGLTDRSGNSTVITDNGVAIIAPVAAGAEQNSITANGGTITAPVTTGGAIYGWERVGPDMVFRANTGWVGVSEAAGVLTIADGTEVARLRYTNGAGPSSAQFTVIENADSPCLEPDSDCHLGGTMNMIQDISYDRGSGKLDIATGDGNSTFFPASILERSAYTDSSNSPLTSDNIVAVSRVNDQLALASDTEAILEINEVGTVNIEWVNATQQNARVLSQDDDNPTDLKPGSYADTSFEVISTTATSTDSSTPPANTTHAVVTSVSGSHYVRKLTDPATGTGGVTVMSGANRVIDVSDGSPLKVVLTA